MTDDKGQLNHEGHLVLKDIFEHYQIIENNEYNLQNINHSKNNNDNNKDHNNNDRHNNNKSKTSISYSNHEQIDNSNIEKYHNDFQGNQEHHDNNEHLEEIEINIEIDKVEQIQEIENQLKQFQNNAKSKDSKASINTMHIEDASAIVKNAKIRFYILLGLFIVISCIYISIVASRGKEGLDKIGDPDNNAYYPSDESNSNSNNDIGVVNDGTNNNNSTNINKTESYSNETRLLYGIESKDYNNI